MEKKVNVITFISPSQESPDKDVKTKLTDPRVTSITDIAIYRKKVTKVDVKMDKGVVKRRESHLGKRKLKVKYLCLVSCKEGDDIKCLLTEAELIWLLGKKDAVKTIHSFWNETADNNFKSIEAMDQDYGIENIDFTFKPRLKSGYGLSDLLVKRQAEAYKRSVESSNVQQ